MANQVLNGDVDETELTAIGAGLKRRLIEEWLPIAALSEESIRERRSMTALPPTYYLHVWWARRPLVASRAAVLASLLPFDADHAKFLHALGIHGDPIAAKVRIAEATKNNERLGAAAYGYLRAFSFNPTDEDRSYLRTLANDGEPPKVLDSTAGGGSIPFEAMRLGCDTYGNDLNPVAWLILRATVEFPARYGERLHKRVAELGKKFASRCRDRLERLYPAEPLSNCVPDGYLWARTVHCPYCSGLVPLSPNWKLNNRGVGVRLVPQTGGGKDRTCSFEIVHELVGEHSVGTVTGGDGLCPFPDCARVIDGDEIKSQAKAGKMGEQLYAVVYTERTVVGHSKNGKPKVKKIRGFRAATTTDDNGQQVKAALDAKMPEWSARNIIPNEEFPTGTNDSRPLQYGMPLWRDMFSPRQLYGHGTSVEVFQELLDECGGPGKAREINVAALAYLSLSIDKLLNYNARSVRWHANREVVAGVFDRHDFAFLWSYAEMAPCVAGLGYDWAIKQTGKALSELGKLAGHTVVTDSDRLDFARQSATQERTPIIRITRGSGDDLSHLDDGSINAVVIDPPYYDNVMYAELADFFYVWLKRTAGLLFPEEFADHLTDKDREAVANPAKFKDFAKVRGSGGMKKRAARDYQERMQAIFAVIVYRLDLAGKLVAGIAPSL